MLTIHRGERADTLVDALVDQLAVAPADPFTPEVIAVPTRGVERWLTHRIGARLGTSGAGRGDGVCANVEFPFPGRLVGDVLAEATGVDREHDPWRPERLVWPVLDVLDDCATEPWLAMVGRHIGAQGGDDGLNGLRTARRYPAARHIADLFDRYGIYRPAMIESWLAASDDAAGDHDPEVAWQRRLFRRVRAHVGVPSPAERMSDACARLRADEVALDLPPRVSLFGLTRLPQSYLEVLRAVATHRTVHLFALHPSLALWDRMAELEPRPTPGPRQDDPTRRLAAHPLLRTWAQDSREMQIVLSAAAESDVVHRPTSAGPARTLLERLQHDIRDDQAPPADRADRIVLDPDDRSLQVHACHGRSRQVEILRDAICHLLADDETLEPRDVIVLCPDIDEFAPLLHATFGARPEPGDESAPSDATGIPHLPYRLADRSLRQSNPLLGALAELLALLDARLTTSEVLGFAGRPPVRRRFGFDDEALERIGQWSAETGVRWGLDAAHRAAWDLGRVPDHTWRAGLDRLLLGVTMDTDGARLLGDRLPLDDIDNSGEVDLAGRFAEYVDRLDHLVVRTRDPMPLGEWIDLLGSATDDLLAASGADQWQRIQVDAILREVNGEAGAGGSGPRLGLTEVRALLAGRLQGVPTTGDFRTGAITMCTLVPMRAVPHRVVCILGLDDGVFPRTVHVDGDDLLFRTPMIGDRDPRTEDRQLLLDAVLAATDHLLVTYSGHDERTNEPRPPSVPLHELLAVVDAIAVGPDDRPARAHVEHHHPLQPFDPRCFQAGRPWSFDRTQLEGARALRATRRPPTPFLPDALPAVEEPTVALDELIRFVQDPPREFLRQRLELPTWSGDDDRPDHIPIELDGLGNWQIGDAILRRLLDGVELDRAVRAEIGSGTLPPGDLRNRSLADAANAAQAIRDLAAVNGAAGPFSSIEVDVEVPSAQGPPVRVIGTVAAISDSIVTDVSFSRISPKTRLALWTRLLAVSAARPDQSWETVGLGKEKGGGRVVRHRPIDGPADARAATASQLLGRLVDLRRRGLCEPLPLPCRTAEAYASAAARGRPGAPAAAEQWAGRFGGERTDDSVVRIWGPGLPYEVFAAVPPTAAETGPGWGEDPSRLGRLATHLWGPILAREVWR